MPRYVLAPGAVVVYDSKLFGVNNQIGRWAHRLARNYHRYAIKYAPVNKRVNKSQWGQLAFYSTPGAMQRAIAQPGSVSAQRIGVRHWDITLQVNVPYALAVIKGTTGPITAKTYRTPFAFVRAEPGGRKRKKVLQRVSVGLPYMVLPANAQGGNFRRRAHSVSGQKPNKYLDYALAATSRLHPSVKGGFRKAGYRSFGNPGFGR